ncbi:chemotaxis protein CheD [Methylocaldum sp.]|uniref:chemotaxis protein CheD n=1 Tax=Methylocaldum sp. TaxID=1969727 RepID=UPI002D63DB45|nr:chemotaxis protein CheD [Methylocaldum sp.]HYE36754.1 chemotaxis protein CheD [Methylocaldum sp.]
MNCSVHSTPIFREIHLRPGDFYFGHGPVRLITLLGSCVAAILWHPRLRVGGMCHYVLPARCRGTEQEPDGRYADEVMELFRREIVRIGAPSSEYRVRLFGGGKMFSGRLAPAALDVGTRNVEAARCLAMHLGLTVDEEHLGGIGYRRLAFELWSGRTLLEHRQDLIELSDTKKKDKRL